MEVESKEFLSSVLSSHKKDEAVLVTQYKSSFTSEAPINDKNYGILKRRWPCLIWSDLFDAVPSPSHFLLQLTDGVISHSSSLIFQAMAWKKKIDLVPSSYFSAFSASNFSEIERNSKLLAFILGRYNLDASFALNGDFLASLIQEFIARKKHPSIANALPIFSDIDASYHDKVLARFDYSKITKAISRVDVKLNSRIKAINDYSTLAHNAGVRVLSFDIFDTLITRPLDNPKELFNILHQKVEQATGRRLHDFSNIRIWAQSAAHEKLEEEEEEITLDQIYKNIAYYYGINDPGYINFLKNIEVDLEFELITHRDIGKDIWNIARASGKPIILISDMYLPCSAIKKMLAKCGYTEPFELFLSSSYLKTKRTGSLYEEVIAKLEIPGNQILHIGDNRNNDITQAEKKRIRTFHFFSSSQRFNRNKIYSTLFPTKWENECAKSMLCGLINLRMFDGHLARDESVSLFHKEPWRLGYAALGPFVVGFCQWLHREAVKENKSKLYFLSREGFLFRSIYKELFGNSAVPSEYLYCSRRAVRVAAMESAEDVAEVANEAFDRDAQLEFLLKHRFALPEEIATKLAEGQQQNMKKSNKGRLWFSNFARQIAPQIIDNARTERENYVEYLKNSGFMDEVAPAVVDVGWKGSMQLSLANLRKSSLSGYYVATLAGAENNEHDNYIEMSGYLGKRISLRSSEPIITHRKLVEFLICHTDRSFSHFSRASDGSIAPVFLEESQEHQRVQFISEAHRGALMFARDYKSFFGRYDNSSLIDFRLSASIFNSFLCNPTSTDAEMIKNFLFENDYAGAARRKLLDVWLPGKNILENAEKEPSSSPVKNRTKPVTTPQPRSISSRVIHEIEKPLIKILWSKKQFAKYLRDDERFFSDSKISLVKKWKSLRAKLMN